jgi:hypothetical protein
MSSRISRDGSTSSHGAYPSTHRYSSITKEKGIFYHYLIYDSTEGFSVEFATLNPQGFFFYSLYTVAGYVDPNIGAGSVATNDLFFALHAFLISCVQLTQIFVYGKV